MEHNFFFYMIVFFLVSKQDGLLNVSWGHNSLNVYGEMHKFVMSKNISLCLCSFVIGRCDPCVNQIKLTRAYCVSDFGKS